MKGEGMCMKDLDDILLIKKKKRSRRHTVKSRKDELSA